MPLPVMREYSQEALVQASDMASDVIDKLRRTAS